MGTLACMLKKKGFNVSGSDLNIYPPMSDMLNAWGININIGYNKNNVKNADLIIIGNAVSRGNVEVEYVLNKGIPYLSMAGALYAFFLKDKDVISVSGTHGKTTTSALIAHILEYSGYTPSFFIGGVLNDYDANYKLGSGDYFVVEGDEYDSAFFEKIPKFILYRPHHLILTSLEFDHADIYNSIDEVELWFKRLVNIIPSNGKIVFSGEYPALYKVAERSLSEHHSFGKDGCDFKNEFLGFSGDFSKLQISSKDYGDLKLETRLFGEYNFLNITAAVSMALMLGVNKLNIQRAVASFSGVKRRQELIYNSDKIKIFEDFAHHPTAIRSVIKGMRARYPNSCIWAIYEPRSATSRRNVFQNELSSSFKDADRVVIKSPYMLSSIPEKDRIDIDEVLNIMIKKGMNARLFDHVDDIVNYVFEEINIESENLVVIMSNGGFDDIYNKMSMQASDLVNL